MYHYTCTQCHIFSVEDSCCGSETFSQLPGEDLHVHVYMYVNVIEYEELHVHV